jgi:phosphoenolpyruvate synthase/pyruvate phosphate dikinase
VKILKKELGLNFSEEIVSIITAPTHPSFINEYEWEIRELSVILKSHNQKELDSKISNIIKKYFWLRTNYYNHDILDKEYILSEAGKMISKSDDLSFYNNNKDKKLEIINKLGLSQSFKNLVKVVESLTYIQDKRKECVLRNNYVLFDLLKEVRSRNNDDIDITRYFTLNHEEIFDLLEEKKIDWKIVEKRYKEGFLVMYHDGIADYVYKEDIEKLKLNKIIIKNNATFDFKGAIAFKGKVVGKVRILRTINDIQNFIDGDILVANQTTPEFVPAMKKAKAIITDQGGITSHAAIIARELKVPCIIGTKIATRVLKDGDIVEVDANAGIVKILKQ